MDPPGEAPPDEPMPDPPPVVIPEGAPTLLEERQAQRLEQEAAFEEERLARRERGRHHLNYRVDAIMRAAVREETPATPSRPPRGMLPELDAILDRHPGARVVQTTHDEVTVEVQQLVPVQQPDWRPVKINVELKNEWEKIDLPPQTQWERLLAED